MDTTAEGTRVISRRGFVHALAGGGAAVASGLAGSILGAARPALAEEECTQAPYTTDVTYNICHTTSCRLLLAGNHTVQTRVQISYLGGKAGQPPVVEFDEIPAVYVDPSASVLFDVDLSHPAFAGGYGAVRARAVNSSGGPVGVPFYAYSILDSPPSFHLVSGSTFLGTSFKLPLASVPQQETQRVLLAITVMGGRGSLPVRIQHFGGDFDSTILVAGNSTLLWDSASESIDLGAGQLRVHAASPLVVSAFLDRRRPSYDQRLYLTGGHSI